MVNDYNIDDIVWMGPQPTIADRAFEGGITENQPVSELEKTIYEAKRKGRQIHFFAALPS